MQVYIVIVLSNVLEHRLQKNMFKYIELVL